VPLQPWFDSAVLNSKRHTRGGVALADNFFVIKINVGGLTLVV
jgi:hypothetical protein